MKKMVASLLCAVSTYAISGNQSGTIDYITVRASDGLIYFALKEGGLSNRPSCATMDYWMIKDENSSLGLLQYSMILSAQTSGKTIKISGMNTCKRWLDGEDVDSIQILSQ